MRQCRGRQEKRREAKSEESREGRERKEGEERRQEGREKTKERGMKRERAAKRDKRKGGRSIQNDGKHKLKDCRNLQKQAAAEEQAEKKTAEA